MNVLVRLIHVRSIFTIVGEEKQYKKRIYLLYDGIHYDPLVWNLAPEANNKDWDVKVFNPDDYKLEQAAQAFARKEFQVPRTILSSSFL